MAHKTQPPQEHSWIEIASTKVDSDVRWNWLLWSTNGRPVAVSAISYSRKHDATRAAGFAKEAFADEGLRILAAQGEIDHSRTRPVAEAAETA